MSPTSSLSSDGLSETYVPDTARPSSYMRTQNDSPAENRAVADACQIECFEEGARQEFRDEADINYLVDRMLRGERPDLRPIQHGEVDFDLDYTQARQVVDQADRAYSMLPLAVRQRFPSWQALVAAVNANPELFNTTGAVDGVPPSTEPVGAPAGVEPSATPQA